MKFTTKPGGPLQTITPNASPSKPSTPNPKISIKSIPGPLIIQECKHQKPIRTRPSSIIEPLIVRKIVPSAVDKGKENEKSEPQHECMNGDGVSLRSSTEGGEINIRPQGPRSTSQPNIQPPPQPQPQSQTQPQAPAQTQTKIQLKLKPQVLSSSTPSLRTWAVTLLLFVSLISMSLYIRKSEEVRVLREENRRLRFATISMDGEGDYKLDGVIGILELQFWRFLCFSLFVWWVMKS